MENDPTRQRDEIVMSSKLETEAKAINQDLTEVSPGASNKESVNLKLIYLTKSGKWPLRVKLLNYNSNNISNTTHLRNRK